MRITADQPQFVFESVGNVISNNGKSFTQLLEAGLSAGEVAGQRALGYSEAGLMGLHFEVVNHLCVQMPKTSQDSDSPMAVEMAGAVPVMPAELTKADFIDPDVGDTSESVGSARQSTALQDNLSRALASVISSSILGSPDDLVHEKICEATNDVSGTARTLQRDPVGSSEARVVLTRRDGQVQITVDGFAFDDSEKGDLEAICHDICARFGVTVSKLFVRTAASKNT